MKKRLEFIIWLIIAVAYGVIIYFESIKVPIDNTILGTFISIVILAIFVMVSLFLETINIPKKMLLRRFVRKLFLPIFFELVLLCVWETFNYHNEAFTSISITIMMFCIIYAAFYLLKKLFPKWEYNILKILGVKTRSYLDIEVYEKNFLYIEKILCLFLSFFFCQLIKPYSFFRMLIFLFCCLVFGIIMYVCVSYIEISRQRKKYKLKPFSPSDNIKLIHSAAEHYIRYIDSALFEKKVQNIAITGDLGIGKSSLLKTYEKKKKKNFIHLSVSDLAEVKENSSLTQADIERNLLKRLLTICQEKDIPVSRFCKVPENIPSLRIKSTAFLFAMCALDILIIIFENFIRTINFIPDNLENKIKIIEKIVENVDIDLAINISKFFLFPITFFFVYNVTMIFIGRYKLSKFNAKIANGDSEANAEFDLRIEPKDLDTNYMEIVYVLEQIAKKGNYVFVFEDMDRFNAEICVPILLKLRQFNEILNERISLNQHKFKRYKFTFIYVLRECVFEEYQNLSNLPKNSFVDLYKFCDMVIPVIPEMGAYNSVIYLENRMKELGTFNYQFLSEIAPYLIDYRLINDVENEYKIFENIYQDELETECDRTELLACVLFKIFYPVAYYELRKYGKYTKPYDDLYVALEAEYNFVNYFSPEQCVRFIGGNENDVKKFKLKKVLERIQEIIEEMNNIESKKKWLNFYTNNKNMSITTYNEISEILLEIDRESCEHELVVKCFDLISKEYIGANVAKSYVETLVKLEKPTVEQVELVLELTQKFIDVISLKYYIQISRKLIDIRISGIKYIDKDLYISVRRSHQNILSKIRGMFIKRSQNKDTAKEFANFIFDIVKYEDEQCKWKCTDIFKYNIMTENQYCNNDTKKFYSACLLSILDSTNTSCLNKKMKIIRRIRDDWDFILFEEGFEKYRKYLNDLVEKDNNKKESKNLLIRLSYWFDVKVGITAKYNEIRCEIERINKCHHNTSQ